MLNASVSEDNGIKLLNDSDLYIYSVGISTGGIAEIRMAETNPKRHIIATTIDKAGVDFAKNYIAKRQLQKQIDVKLEDVALPLTYTDAYFDYIYARLVLHYLPKAKLVNALDELYRVLKPRGKIFIVVRSIKCPDATRDDASFDPYTCLTTCTYLDKKTGKQHSYSRYFHTEESISKHASDAGFNIEYVKSYDEHLFIDFMRTIKSPKTDNVIELLAYK